MIESAVLVAKGLSSQKGISGWLGRMFDNAFGLTKYGNIRISNKLALSIAADYAIKTGASNLFIEKSFKLLVQEFWRMKKEGNKVDPEKVRADMGKRFQDLIDNTDIA
jgi:hypothetical protein